MVRAIADGINKRFDDFLEAEVLDTGKPYSVAIHVDIPGVGPTSPPSPMCSASIPPRRSRWTPRTAWCAQLRRRRPRGVIGIISPWNLPLLLMTWKVGPALACGNTVVVKPSEVTPSTATLLGEVMNEVGVPEGVYNVVHGFGDPVR